VGLIRRVLDHKPKPKGKANPIPHGGVLTITTTDGMNPTSVVGESFRQEAIARACGRVADEEVHFDTQAVLLAEIDNPADRNAIMVWVNDEHVGYLPRELAVEYRAPLLIALARGIAVVCDSFISAHSPNSGFHSNAGVNVFIPTPPELVELIRDATAQIDAAGET
jgi:hypothetical protein